MAACRRSASNRQILVRWESLSELCFKLAERLDDKDALNDGDGNGFARWTVFVDCGELIQPLFNPQLG